MSGRVRGLFAGDAYMALEVCDTGDFEGTLSVAHMPNSGRCAPPEIRMCHPRKPLPGHYATNDGDGEFRPQPFITPR